MENQTIATGDVIGSMVRRRIKDQKYNQYLGDTLRRLTVNVDYQDTIIMSGLRLLEKLFDYRWRSYVSDALYINDPSILSQKAAKNSLRATIEEIFGDGIIEWNRIALVVTIVSLLADEALRIGNITRVLHYVTWTEEYFRSKLIDAWIDRKNGWAEIYSFARLREDEVNATFCTAMPHVKPKSFRSQSSPPQQEKKEASPERPVARQQRDCGNGRKADDGNRQLSAIAKKMQGDGSNNLSSRKSLEDISPNVRSPNHPTNGSEGKLPENSVSIKRSPQTGNSAKLSSMASKQLRMELSRQKNEHMLGMTALDEESSRHVRDLIDDVANSDRTKVDVSGLTSQSSNGKRSGVANC